LRVWAKTEDEGLVEKSLPATGQTKIAFNIKLLKELVAHVGEELVLHTTSPGEVAKVKVGKTTHLLMPMVVQWEN
jgi:DNA polymerase III sliding clamp (beta) subunit (PCNA family)